MTVAKKDSEKLANESAGLVVNAVYRLVKTCMLHNSGNNNTVVSAAGRATEAIRAYCAQIPAPTVSLVFLGDSIFVNGQILKTSSRDMHALAVELGNFLSTCGLNELSIGSAVVMDEIVLFGRALTDALRDPSLVPNLQASLPSSITTSRARATAGKAVDRDDSPSARVARTYAVAMSAVQEMNAALAQRRFVLPPKMKRVAQKLVTHAEQDSRMLVALATLGRGAGDLAGVAVSSAILAVAMARQLTEDRVLLSNMAMSALLLDVGRYLDGSMAGGLARTLNEDELDRIPPSAAVMMTAMGKLQAPSRMRATIVYEALALRRTHRIGAPYKGRRTPTVHSRILVTARAFAELRAANLDSKLSIDDAVQVLMNRAETATDRTYVKLLVGALGIYPAGTMVELNTGELAVVMATPAMPVDFVRPPVKILYDEHTNLLDEPLDVDLSAPRKDGGPMRFIRKSINADDQQMKAMRSFVLAATAAARRGAIAEDEAVAGRAAPAAPSAGSPAQVSFRADPAPAGTDFELEITVDEGDAGGAASGSSSVYDDGEDDPTAVRPRTPPAEPVRAPVATGTRRATPPARQEPPRSVASGSLVSSTRRVGQPISRTDSSPPSAGTEEVFARMPYSVRPDSVGRREPRSSQREVLARPVSSDADPPLSSPVAQPASPVHHPAAPEANRTTEVNWETYRQVVLEQGRIAEGLGNAEAEDLAQAGAERPTARPHAPAAESMPPRNSHDDLLAEFLSDDEPEARAQSAGGTRRKT